MFARTRTYEVSLVRWSDALAELGDLRGVADAAESFRAAEEEFADSDDAWRSWTVEGRGWTLSIRFEEYEDYLVGTLRGKGKQFEAISKHLWFTYILHGGHPDAVERPW